MKVLAAMSGGVDSAVAAARAVAAGHDVTGVHLALSPSPASYREGARGCCSLEDSRDARRAADMLDIPFYVWDVAERFGRDVVDDFVAEYAAGRTPNPCVRCNERIKFSAVLDRAVGLGFDAVCTGHYARIVDGRLTRAVDPAKDQSYVLAVLRPEQLGRAMFPVGDSRKSDVRVEAERWGLGVAAKPDSHDICFIPHGDTRSWLQERLGEQPGDIVDAETGAVVGAHSGTYAFTVGQRRGLGLSVPAPGGRPRYVLDISPVARTVTVGNVEDLDVAELVADTPTWCGPQPSLPFTGHAQLRAHGEVHDCVADVVDEALLVTFADRPRGVAPGQTVVLYDGDAVVGSATIRSTS
ncbi:MAG TPA: tRNA 2-thiouridine(34) synthase MnmA [Mycobacteriales bacterium]|nr:tRNA 2-thiouridine(34) synthase MnmA [Mycobacteriales bacterium]